MSKLTLILKTIQVPSVPIYYFVISPSISLDEGADGYNVGEYLVCDTEINQGIPSFQWFYCDTTGIDTNRVDLTGEEPIRTYQVSQPNRWQGSVFLPTGLGIEGKYIGCEVTVGNISEKDYTSSTIGSIQGTPIYQSNLVGGRPYYPPSASTTYYLAENISSNGSAIILGKANQKLNLNGKKITYNNEQPLMATSFDEGNLNNWDLTYAPNTYIYTGTNYEQDFNSRKLIKGNNALVIPNEYLVETGVQHYVSYIPTMSGTRYNWYTASAIVYRNATSDNTASSVFLRVKNTGTIIASTSNIARPYRGMFLLSVSFQAHHSMQEYTLEIGASGYSGVTTTSDLYIDSISLSRGHTAGIYGPERIWDSSKNVGTVEIFKQGSGYIDGTYNNIQTTYVSGARSDYPPDLNITILSGMVTGLTIVDRGEAFFSHGGVFSAPSNQIGSGTGFQFKVASLNAKSSTFTSLVQDHTDYWSNSSSNIVVKNGEIEQGVDRLGVNNSAIRLDSYSDIHRIKAKTHGPDSSVIRAIGESANNYIRDCVLETENCFSSNRDNYYGAMIYYFDGTIQNCKILGAPTAGIVNKYSMIVRNNILKGKNKFTNGRILAVGGLYQNWVYNNIIENTGEYYGRACSINGKTNFYDNIVKMEPSRYNNEYVGFYSEGDYAIQTENIGAGNIINIYNNKIYVYATGFKTQNGEFPIAAAMRWNDLDPGGTINFYNNEITCYASNSGYAAAYKASEVYSTSGINLYDNTVTTNDGFWISAVNFYDSSKRDTIVFQEDLGLTRRTLMIGYSNSSFHTRVSIIDPIISSGDLNILKTGPTYDEPRFGTTNTRGMYHIKWTNTFIAPQSGLLIRIYDKNNSIVSSGLTDSTGYFSSILSQYHISGSSVVDYNSGSGYRYSVTGGSQIAFTSDSVKQIIL